MVPTAPPGQGQVPDVGHPWLDALIESAFLWFTVLVGAVGLYTRYVHPKAKELLTAVRAIREQTENSHASAPYPNLRDNIDANHAENLANHAELMAFMGRLEARLARLEADNDRQEKDLGGVRAEVREDRREHNRLAERVAYLEAGREPGYRRAPGFHRKTPTEEEDDALTF